MHKVLYNVLHTFIDYRANILRGKIFFTCFLSNIMACLWNLEVIDFDTISGMSFKLNIFGYTRLNFCLYEKMFSHLVHNRFKLFWGSFSQLSVEISIRKNVFHVQPEESKLLFYEIGA